MKTTILILLTTLLLTVLNEAKPSLAAPVNIEPENYVTPNKHVRVRRQYGFDLNSFMKDFWKNMGSFNRDCKDCDLYNIGNGYKNKNKVFIRPEAAKNNIFNIGNGYKNENTVFVNMQPSEEFMKNFWNS